MKKTPLIIDTDPGVDDSLAILYSLLSECDVRALSTVYGNATVDKTTRNAVSILSLIGRNDIPVLSGSTVPLFKQPRIAESHGLEGIGGFDRFVQSAATLDFDDFFVSQLKKQKMTFLCLGPLTNIARFFGKYPELTSQVEELVMIGGVFGEKGNITPYAEFNVYNDPDALKVVLDIHITKVLIPADVCRKVTIGFDEFSGILSESSLRDSVLKLVQNYIDYYQNDSIYGGFSGGVMYDLLAVSYFRNPSFFSLKPSFVEVDVSDGQKRGMTAFAQADQANCFRAIDVDEEKVKKDFFSVF